MATVHTLKPHQLPGYDPVAEALSRLEGVKAAGSDKWAALCPAHEDHKPSLSIGRGTKKDCVTFTCHAGCKPETVAAAIGMAWPETFAPDPLKAPKVQPVPAKKKHSPVADATRNAWKTLEGNPIGPIVARYDYCDESGGLLYQVTRHNLDGEKTFRPWRPAPGDRWYPGLGDAGDVRPVPYHLLELLASPKAEPVFIPEGEKDVANLEAAGLVATTNHGGAGPGKWRPEYAEHLKGRAAVILPDNDDTGKKHAAAVAASLYGKASSVRVVELPDLPEKGDVSDWLAAGGTAAELLGLVEAAPEWRPLEGEAGTVAPESLMDDGRPAPEILTLRELFLRQFPPREMVLSPIIRANDTTMVYAPPGHGKTFLNYSLCLTVAAGGSFLKWHAPKPRRVLLVDGEMQDVDIQDRMAKLLQGMDIDQGMAVDNLEVFAAGIGDYGSINIGNPAVQALIESRLEPGMFLSLDNISTLYNGDHEENSAEWWAPVQAWLLKLRRLKVAVVFYHHSNKGGGYRATSKMLDAIDTCIRIERPRDYEDEQGARFEMHFQKGRHLSGKDGKPFEAWLQKPEGVSTWTMTDLADSTMQRIADLWNDDADVNEIKAATNLDRSTVYRNLRRAGDEGLLDRPAPAKKKPRK